MTGFTEEETRRARAFHLPRYRALVADLALALGALAALTLVKPPGQWWAAAVWVPLVVDGAVALVRLPVGWWRYRHDRAFGLTEQRTPSWALDQAKAVGVGAALDVITLAPLFALAHWLPRAWPWLAAPGAALLTLLLGFVAPVVLEPVFNRFEPLADEELEADLKMLAEQAGAPVREILVADASRRTNRSNAYVSGIGRTRRVVLWDTLLTSPVGELRVVVAHELAHRARHHVAALTALAMSAAAAFVVLIRIVRAQPTPRDTALILLLGLLAELAVAPAASALSRHFERVADRFSLQLTGNLADYRALHHRLAVTNLADLSPPRILYYLLASHPTPPERLSST